MERSWTSPCSAVCTTIIGERREGTAALSARYPQVPPEHLGTLGGHWLLWMHCTHRAAPPPPLQYGVDPEQSVLLAHCTHCCLAEQMGVDVLAQSALPVHCTHCAVTASQCAALAGHCALLEQPGTHWAVDRSQCGVLAGHCALLVQPWVQVKLCGSQKGCDEPQSEFARHWTHALLATRHLGWLAGQSPLAAHCTHCCVLESQTFADAGQSTDVLQPTQSPELVQSMRPVGH